VDIDNYLLNNMNMKKNVDDDHSSKNTVEPRIINGDLKGLVYGFRFFWFSDLHLVISFHQ
jgi:hypothetical protein